MIQVSGESSVWRMLRSYPTRLLIEHFEPSLKSFREEQVPVSFLLLVCYLLFCRIYLGDCVQ